MVVADMVSNLPVALPIRDENDFILRVAMPIGKTGAIFLCKLPDGERASKRRLDVLKNRLVTAQFDFH
jgi:hypothetical protein